MNLASARQHERSATPPSRVSSYLHDPAARPPGLVLGYGYNMLDQDQEGAVVVPWDVANRHTYILGATGSGKTVLQRNLAYQFVRAGYGVLLIDLKGEPELLWDLWRGCVAAGRQEDFVYLSPVLEDKFMLTSAAWNPLINGDASVVAGRLMDAWWNPSPEAEFFEKVKADIILATITALKATGKVFTFEDITYALSSKAAMGSLLAMFPKGSDPYRMLNDVITEWTQNPKVYISYLKSTKVACQMLAVGLAKTVCNAISPTFDVARAVERRQVVYCLLPTMRAREPMQALGRILVSELKNTFAEIQLAQDRPAKFAIVIDEFQKLIFPGIMDLFSTARSAGVSLVVSHQTLADLDYQMRGEAFGRSLLDNCATKLIMATRSKDSARAMADIIGEWPPIPLLGKFITLRYLVQPDTLMGKNEYHQDGLGTGELVAKIEGDIFRVTVPAGAKRVATQRPGDNIPKPSGVYKEIDYGQPLNLAKP
jgi:hypothetical protein